MGLGVGHEAQDPAGGVRDAGDVQQRAVGVVRESARRPRRPSAVAYFKAIWPRSLISASTSGGGEKFPFAVADGQLQLVQPLGEDAVGGRRP